ncbi:MULTISPECIES: lycopene cyclase domain-containing protein [unclassified Microbacterium]|uniref:lycopene cyclase domain-containing protein n=1 Tax=unclassified Microbacterium TaxID=2609290 RepID=UPI00214CFCB1|nr:MULTISPECIES: lycopene cyclase domain-containing protein [unclassified Microbacterium]MCR2784486.1 lycopene cyclase domain-containing protein [Microbacterium sp. zg.B96]WIM14702.1 lycopene cyclase domain-containing protein [Microbacterium sp. zg-B96]
MPGLYLLAILLSAAGIALLDARLQLAFWDAPGRTVAAVGIGTAFFVAWDAAGIAAGVFIKGDSPLLIGIDLAPHLPMEEPLFLAFLCYLALVCFRGAERVHRRLRQRREEPS